ncbi:amino acid ABC transporter [Marinomonas ushuaiensis DSM 15871]|uniref:Amino acid ABC transporter n=1 Tax=Marinomonas ushuaiensis DSM 15871 TaxID=1122207 RepID=X7EBQ0_9GAMM|nr:amino acid ABC transporter permease [Marinomonas ushuaiensis]ETX12641.1 amino acid ABC transporter [Marinomonas ushuaiensis DSM 15871]
MTFDIQVIIDHLPEIASGFGLTILCTVVAALIAMVLGLFVALGLMSKAAVFRYPVRLYVEIIRGTPFLIQLFLLYYGGPSFGLYLEPIEAGIIGLAIYCSAYFAELFRSGFNSISLGQLEAAQIMGFSKISVLWRIQIPQMMVLITPGLVNICIILGKETTILSIVTVPELAFVLTGIGSETYAYAETLTVLAISYLILSELTARFGSWTEKRLSKYMERSI